MALRSPATPSGPLSLTGPITITGGAVTVSTPLLNLTQTWNAVGTTFTGILENVTDTASASGSLLMDLQVGGASKFSFRKDGLFTPSNGIDTPGNINIASAAGYFINADVKLVRDAANTLALRNGVNAQAFNVYNTYTDASNYERGGLSWSGNILTLTTANAGTGAVRQLGLGINGAANWYINTSGNLIAAADNSTDIGASGANRPRNVFVAGGVTVGGTIGAGGNFTAGTTSSINWSARTDLRAPSDGTIQISNAALTNTATITVGASNLLTFQGGGTFGGAVQTGLIAIGSLPAAAAGLKGARYMVSDCNVVASGNFGANVTSGGANVVPVFCDGVNWKIG